MFSYEPFTNEQLNELQGLLPDGVYKFFLDQVNFKTSKSSNPMLEVHLWIKDSKGNTHTLKDYIVSMPSMAWKLKHFCETVGLSAEYEIKKITEHSFKRGMIGHVELKVQEGNENGKGGYYPDKNAVKDYIVKQDNTFASIAPLKINERITEIEKEFLNDAIPF